MCLVSRFFLLTIFLSVVSTIEGTDNCPVPCLCTYKGNIIQVLDCSNLNWRQIPSTFNWPSSVVHLSLAYSQFEVLHNGSFANLSILQSLDISHNHLSSLEYSCFKGLDSLINLNMSYNNLKMTTDVYAPGIFRYLKHLKVLHIHGNIRQSTVDQNYPDVALSDLEFLEVLTMDGLTDITFGQGFRKLRHLTLLDMSVRDDESSCVLLNVLNITFSSLSNSTLSVLKLVQCNIYHIAPGAFSMLKYLAELNLSENHRLTFAGMKNASFGLNLTHIQILSLNGINRHSDPWTLRQSDFVYFHTTSLKALTLDSNRITNIEGGVIDILPTSLEVLTFRDNYLTDAHFLANLVHLENLLVFDISYQLAYSVRQENTSGRAYPPLPTHLTGREENEYFPKVEGGKENMRTVQLFTKYFTTEVDSLTKSIKPNKLKYISLRHDKRDDVLQLPFKLKKIIGSNLKIDPLSAPPLTFDSNNSLEYLDLSSNGVHAWYGKWSGLHYLGFFKYFL